MNLHFLTLHQVIDIHQQLIKTFGGISGIRDINLLESAVMRPQTGYYENLQECAAAFMESLANNHAFLDGNKRIAFFATDVFLRINGYKINCEAEETYQYFMRLFETNNFTYHELLSWLNFKIESLSKK